ncbi:F-box protein At5g07670-like isoform X2 [Andrographis paniculata]|uniref:F-box protein At5g07670-like isoform X2 n=1 Tax=Andrographis paniculata TaxID=175694 RepID=UPI0021E8C99C|nr:F-box protein At5g07670-like isoform X2 [Andrographis paniculata]
MSDRSPGCDRRISRQRRLSWCEPFSGEYDEEALKNVIRKMRLLSFPNSGSITPRSESEPESETPSNPSPLSALPDCTALLSDELLVKVFERISERKQLLSNSLVCKRWCSLCGRLIESIRLLDWEFLESGRLAYRFPNLVDVNILPASIRFERNSGILLSTESFGVYLNSSVLENDGSFVRKLDILPSERIDGGVRILSEGCKNLRKISLMNVGEEGLTFLATECEMLQEMELHNCGDFALRGIHRFQNLQILKLVGRLSGVYASIVSDIGMTILAQGCRRLLKLELMGCEGSFDGIKAIGMCCEMLAELTICSHRMEGGWLSALSYCKNLKILRIKLCKYIDDNPGLDEHLRSCPMLEELHLSRCQLRFKHGVRSLFLVCRAITGLVVEDCWGLDNGA